MLPQTFLPDPEGDSHLAEEEGAVVLFNLT
jgi:hypothetical protein